MNDQERELRERLAEPGHPVAVLRDRVSGAVARGDAEPIEEMPAPRTFTVQLTRTETYEEGFGVHVSPIWGGEDEEVDRVVDIDVSVVPIREDLVSIVGGVACVQVYERAYSPVENFLHAEDLTQDDTHDLRSRWFATEQEAKDHAEYTLSRWAHPEPWCSFVQL